MDDKGCRGRRKWIRQVHTAVAGLDQVVLVQPRQGRSNIVWGSVSANRALYFGLNVRRAGPWLHAAAVRRLQLRAPPALLVQRQLGHASIQLTVDTYGRWLPMGNKAAVDRLDDATPGASGSKVVANWVFGGTGASELPELAGAGGGS